jgi:hypothetical protein
MRCRLACKTSKLSATIRKRIIIIRQGTPPQRPQSDREDGGGGGLHLLSERLSVCVCVCVCVRVCFCGCGEGRDEWRQKREASANMRRLFTVTIPISLCCSNTKKQNRDSVACCVRWCYSSPCFSKHQPGNEHACV